MTRTQAWAPEASGPTDQHNRHTSPPGLTGVG